MQYQKDVAAIREIIIKTRASEDKNHAFANLLAEQVLSADSAIDVPKRNAQQLLLNFVIEYINHVPDFIETVSIAATEAGITDYVDPFLQLAVKYFISPPQALSEHSGIDELMDEAYLAHRLIEEVNDRYIAKAGMPLIPMDMTMANLIIHSLIGEKFANQLDQAVHHTVLLMTEKESVYSQESFANYNNDRKARNWGEALKEWPCLSTHLGIHLNLSEGCT